MLISKVGVDLIKSFEGVRLHAYDDLTGKQINVGDKVQGTLTIGYGHTSGVRAGQTITQDEAEVMLMSDLVYYANAVQTLIDNKTIIFKVTQNMFDALTSFCYNCGRGSLKTLVTKRTISEVAEAMMNYTKSKGVILKGLVRRRTAERELFLKGYDFVSRETYQTYTVVKGDTLTAISKRFNIGVRELAKLNNITDVNLIHVGQVLKLSEGKIILKEYVVKSGDTLSKIAIRLSKSVKYLAETNHIQDVNKIYVGQVIKY